MELLIDRLSVLLDADVSKDEVLRQLNKAKPGLRKGEVFANAERLIGVSTTETERRQAEEFLKDVMSLEKSYVTSAGPLGTTREEVTVWDHPKEPMRFVGLMTALTFIVIGGISYIFWGPAFLFLLPIIGIPATVILSTEWTVKRNKWKAREELDKNIIQNASSFESMLDKVYG